MSFKYIYTYITFSKSEQSCSLPAPAVVRLPGPVVFLHGGKENEDQKECITESVEGARQGGVADFAGGGTAVGTVLRRRGAGLVDGD